MFVLILLRVSSHVVSNLCTEGNPPNGLILEAPFTSLGEEVRYHMLTAVRLGLSALFAVMLGYTSTSSTIKLKSFVFTDLQNPALLQSHLYRTAETE